MNTRDGTRRHPTTDKLLIPSVKQIKLGPSYNVPSDGLKTSLVHGFAKPPRARKDFKKNSDRHNSGNTGASLPKQTLGRRRVAAMQYLRARSGIMRSTLVTCAACSYRLTELSATQRPLRLMPARLRAFIAISTDAPVWRSW